MIYKCTPKQPDLDREEFVMVTDEESCPLCFKYIANTQIKKHIRTRHPEWKITKRGDE
jgi:hypothetical protein